MKKWVLLNGRSRHVPTGMIDYQIRRGDSVPHPKICAIHRVMFFGTTCRNGRIRFRPYTSDNHFWSCGKCTTRISYNTHFTHSKNVLSKSSLTKQLLDRHEPALSIRTCDRRRVFHRPPTRVGTITRKFSKWDQYHPHLTKQQQTS